MGFISTGASTSKTSNSKSAAGSGGSNTIVKPTGTNTVFSSADLPTQNSAASSQPAEFPIIALLFTLTCTILLL